MKTLRAKSDPQREPRRWRTPPPILRGSETLEGMEILREVGGDAGSLLWQSFRNVMFWATGAEEERARLFSPEAGRKRLAELLAADLPADLVDPLVNIGRMLGSPAATSGESVAEACRSVADWAEAHGHEATSLAFTQAAALAAPRNATLAFTVGQKARGRGEHARAETWYRHAIMVGRQTGDWVAYSRAYLMLGVMARGRGNYPLAQRMGVKAVRASRRKGLAEWLARGMHDLFVVATETNRPELAEQYARQAFRAYPRDHERLPALAHDIAYFWMNQGQFARALPVFQALLPHFPLAEDQLLVRAHIARAAGGVGDRDLFRKTWNEAMRLVKEPEVLRVLADSLLEISTGAASLGEWDRAEQAADRALTLANERGETMVAVRAESVLDSVQRGRAVERAVAAATGRQAEQADALAQEMVRSLDSRSLAGV